MVLQVHDELLFEVPMEETEEVEELVRAEMEGVVKLNVPLVADLALARTGGISQCGARAVCVADATRIDARGNSSIIHLAATRLQRTIPKMQVWRPN